MGAAQDSAISTNTKSAEGHNCGQPLPGDRMATECTHLEFVKTDQPRTRVARNASHPAMTGCTFVCVGHVGTWAVATTRRTNTPRSTFTRRSIQSLRHS